MGMSNEILNNNPVLMCGMSMLHSVNYRIEESNAWYKKLENYKNSLPKSDPDYKICVEKLLYLDIALPHTGGTKLAKIIIKASKEISEKNLKIQNIAITGVHLVL